MHYSKEDMSAFDQRVASGFIRRVYKGDLALLNYTDKTTYEKAWDQYTMAARGLVVNVHTGEIVSRCLGKFFNWEQLDEAFVKNLPVDKGYHVFDKLDGSFGLISFYGGQWNLHTRGSFDSPQALKGREMLNNYRMRYLDKAFTYMVEIIYPENKIVVDYGKQEKLVLLTAVHTKSGKEISPEILGYVAEQLGMEPATIYPYTITEMLELKKTLPKDQEGFVVRFANGSRIKIKGDEYMRIARMLSNMTPLALWDIMKNGTIPRQYLAELPEEFRKDYEPIVKELELQYNVISSQILFEYSRLPSHEKTPEGRKTIGLFINNNPELIRYGAMMFAVLDSKWETLDEYIKKKIRPLGNELISFEGTDRFWL